MKKIVSAPYIDQTARWVNGCESISSVMLLQAVGIPIDPDVFIERDLPHAPYWEQEGRLYGYVILASGKIPHEISPVHVVQLVDKEELDVKQGFTRQTFQWFHFKW